MIWEVSISLSSSVPHPQSLSSPLWYYPFSRPVLLATSLMRVFSDILHWIREMTTKHWPVTRTVVVYDPHRQHAFTPCKIFKNSYIKCYTMARTDGLMTLLPTILRTSSTSYIASVQARNEAVLTFWPCFVINNFLYWAYITGEEIFKPAWGSPF